jgi:hypothetical protein
LNSASSGALLISKASHGSWFTTRQGMMGTFRPIGNGLRRLGKEVVYAKYEDEGHWQGTWGYDNQVDYLNRIINWFDKYLKAPDTKSKTPEQ